MRTNADALPFTDGRPTPEGVAREKRVLDALPATFDVVAERAGITVNQALAVLGLLRHRGDVDFIPETARYVRTGR